MTKHVEAIDEFDATFTDCPECDAQTGIVVLKEFVPGIVGRLDEMLIDMRAGIHEQATGHQVLVVRQRRPQ